MIAAQRKPMSSLEIGMLSPEIAVGGHQLYNAPRPARRLATTGFCKSLFSLAFQNSEHIGDGICTERTAA